MACERIYYRDQYLQRFVATVLSCNKTDNGYAVMLDRTAFYPEGGGQPCDVGFIGTEPVLAVRERDGEVVHYTAGDVEEGINVSCEIDWERRFAFMQGHTGEHILSGIIKNRYGFDNVGFHMGREFVTIDINGMLSSDELEEAEMLANKAIYENIKVDADFVDDSQLKAIEFRSKGNLSGDVRIVHIGRYDTCSCCGVHCGCTGEIGLLKIVSSQKYKAGMRIFILCGQQALEDYIAKNRSVYDISALLSAKPLEVADSVRQLMEDNANLKSELSIFKNRVLTHIAEKVPISRCVCVFESGLTPDELRRLCLLICERAEVAAVFSGQDGGYKYAIGSKSLDVRPLTGVVNTELSGRGGGKKGLTQGSLCASEKEIRKLLDKEFSKI